jgi:putative salt-induced outer membrane protein YdiY
MSAARPIPRASPLIAAPLIAASLLTLVLVVSPLGAQGAKPDSAKPVKVTAGIAFLDASGNTDVTSLTVNERLEWKRPRYLWAQFINAINGSTGGKESANLLATGVRGDWKPHGRLSVYSLVNYDRNRFANIGRRFEEGAGLGWSMIERPRHRLTTELGAQFVQQRNLDEVSDNFLAGRAAELYRYTLKENTYIEERVEYLPNLETTEDYRLNGEASIVAPLSRHLSLKAGYVVRFDNLPEPGVKKTDRFLTSGLQISF